MTEQSDFQPGGFRPGDRVRIVDGHFQNFEGDLQQIDATNGRVKVMLLIYGRTTPVEVDYWYIERV